MHKSEKGKWSRSVVSDSSRLPWTVAHQAPPSMGFSSLEYQSGLPLPSPHTTIYKIDNKDQLWSTGPYIQYLIIIYNGKESGKLYIYIYIYIYVCIYIYIYTHIYELLFCTPETIIVNKQYFNLKMYMYRIYVLYFKNSMSLLCQAYWCHYSVPARSFKVWYSDSNAREANTEALEALFWELPGLGWANLLRDMWWSSSLLCEAVPRALTVQTPGIDLGPRRSLDAALVTWRS